MNFFNTLTGRVAKAVDFVVEKNRKTALVNRIRIVIKNERENADRAYVSLGKYYFENLRNTQNEETESLCKSVEVASQRMKKAFQKLDEITVSEDDDEDESGDCGDDCDCCLSYDEDDTAKKCGPVVDDFKIDFSIVDKANDRAAASNEEAADDHAEDSRV